MKKLTFLAIAGTMIFAACGPSAEEIAAQKKHVDDSIAAVKAAEEAKQKHIEDSIAMVKAAEEAKQKAIQDSIAMAEEAAKAKKPAGKKADAPKKASEVKPGQGR